MSGKADVVVAGRFEPGGVVSLWRVRDEGVVRHEGGRLVGTERADDAGSVTFRVGVPGERYIAYSYVNGCPVEVRCSVESVLGQAPQGPVVVKHADGQVVDGQYAPVRDVIELPVDEGPAETPKAAPKRKPARKPAARKAPVKSPPAKKKPVSRASTKAKG